MKSIIQIIFLLLFSLTSYSSNNDIDVNDALADETIFTNTANRIVKDVDSENTKKINEIIVFYTNKMGHLQKTLNHYKKHKSKDLHTIAILEYIIGYIYYMDVETVKFSLNHFKEADKLKKHLKINQEFDLYNAWADAEKINNNIVKAISIFNMGLALAQKTKNQNELFRNYIGIGMIQRDLGLLNISEEKFLMAEKISVNEKFKFSDDINWLKLHLARLYRLKKEYDKSNKYLNEIINDSTNNDFFHYLYYNEKALILYETKKTDSAFYYCNKILLEKKLNQSQLNVLSANLISGKLYYDKKDYKNAMFYLTETVELAKKIGANEDYGYEAAILLIKLINNKNNELSKYYINYLKEIDLKKEMFFKTSKLFVLQLEQIQNSEKILNQKKEQKNKMILITILIILIGFYIILKLIEIRKNYNLIYIKNKKLFEINKEIRKLNLQLSQLNVNLEQFSSIIAHDIKSSIVTIIYLSKEYQKEYQEEIKEPKSYIKEIKNIENEAQKLYKFIDKLLTNVPTIDSDKPILN